jgi:hypothetical protein
MHSFIREADGIRSLGIRKGYRSAVKGLLPNKAKLKMHQYAVVEWANVVKMRVEQAGEC